MTRDGGNALDDDIPEELVLVELVSRVLDKGAVIAGDVVISIAGIDLVHLGLNLYVSSAETARRAGLRQARGPDEPPGVAPPSNARLSEGDG